MHDEQSLDLIDADRRRLVRAASRLLGPADAEDAVQDACVRALEADPQGLDAPQAWLLTVVRHLAIDRLRRRRWLEEWMQQCTAETGPGDTARASPSAEMDASLAEEAARALRLLTACLTPSDGAAVLLYEVFEAGHAEIARASGRSEAGSRQQLRRALLRLRQAVGAPVARPAREEEPSEETVFGLYLRSLQMRDPQALWAMLREAPISARSGMPTVTDRITSSPQTTTCGIVQFGGQLGLVLTLDGVTLCVLPLGVQTEREPEPALLSR